MREQQLDALLSDFRKIADANMADIVLTDEKKRQIKDAVLNAPAEGAEVAPLPSRSRTRKWAAGLAVAAAVLLTVTVGLKLTNPSAAPEEASLQNTAGQTAETPEYADAVIEEDVAMPEEAAVAEEEEPLESRDYFGEPPEAESVEGMDQPETEQSIIMDDIPEPTPEAADPGDASNGDAAEGKNESPTLQGSAPPSDEDQEIASPDGNQHDYGIVGSDNDGGAIMEEEESVVEEDTIVEEEAIVDEDAPAEDFLPESTDEVIVDDAMIEEEQPDQNEGAASSDDGANATAGAVAFVKAMPLAGSEQHLAISLADGVTVTDQATAALESAFADAITDSRVEYTEYGPVQNGWLLVNTLCFNVTESLWGELAPASTITVLGASAAGGLEHSILLKPIENPVIDGVEIRLDLLADYQALQTVALPTESYLSATLTQLGGNQ